MSAFTIAAAPSTDIWRKPPSTNAFNAPTHPLLNGLVPLRTFRRAQITFSAAWRVRYDQGGLFLHLLPAAARETPAAELNAQKRDRWLKTGVEFYEGRPNLSTVATQAWSDWSIAPPAGDGQKVTIEVRREGDELGTSLWVYELVLGHSGEVEQRRPLREVCWFFADEEEWMLDVRAMAARPGKPEGDEQELNVKFGGVVVDVQT
jgi:uncharacterized protein